MAGEDCMSLRTPVYYSSPVVGVPYLSVYISFLAGFILLHCMVFAFAMMNYSLKVR